MNDPQHPYTRALLGSVPDVSRPGDTPLVAIEGRPPSIYAMPTGCPFAPRCPRVMDRCREEYPPSVELGDGHIADCWDLV
jgi:oligopeptide/dipeptide ABC transporter ATP-binding protein